MNSIKIMNSDQIGLTPYSKMEDDNASQSSVGRNSTTTMSANAGNRVWKWPHQWTLNECCCGCSVRTGSLILGWSFLMMSVLIFVGLYVTPTGMRWEEVLLTFFKFFGGLFLLIGIYKHNLFVLRGAIVLNLIDLIAEVIVSIALSIAIGHPLPIILLLILLPLLLYFVVIMNSLANQIVMGIVSPPHLGMTLV